MKKIAYIELDTHAEIAINFRELMEDSKAFSVDYYFGEKILKTLGLQETENIRKATPETIFQQLSTNNYELIIIGTVHRYFNVFEKIVGQYNTAIICHNLNFVKTSNWSLFKAMFKEDFKYRLKLLLKEGLLRKSKVYQKAKHHLVLDEALVNDKYKKLPIFYTQFLAQPKNEVLNIVIPGTVSQKRRDYKKVLQMLQQVPHDKLDVVFLGKAQGKELEMLQGFDKLSLTNIKIKYFKEKVSQTEFDDYMQKADVLWCPIQKETLFFSQKEIYGFTKMSGNVGDAIRYAKPAVFPKWMKGAENTSHDLWNAVKMKPDFSSFEKEKVKERLQKTLLDLL